MFDAFTTPTMVLIFAVGLLAGFVKGTVGFAMPMIMISLFSSLMPPSTALAALIVPTLCANLWQALRGGTGAAVASARLRWRFVATVMVCILFSAQLVTILPARALYLILGIPVIVFCLVQLAGWQLHIAPGARRRTELGLGAFAGLIGGVSGVWGPPTVMYLTALDTPKSEHMRVQGVVYGMGAVMLTLAHLKSGVLDGDTAPLSFLMLIPCGIGLALGAAMQDRLDQARFKRWTLIVLVVVGANLLRRGFTG
ncbi:sulfite exporter TauE/SafE family protein [Oceaniglobus indicus]|uniref:sulfite exporter TauE/SafE family protein n=1 Tax=Oceaniglobus indicus TaxID=2047749 RepID=UPI000C189FD4|nr:sulfite exporter TauE/SafE family protein [Oceaniglobus indicus]